MRLLLVALGGWGLIILSCFPATARIVHDVHGGNCVAYARDVTGVHLDGNAAAWWPHAQGRYERGHKPEVGAILVFKPFGRMHVGHVAVVSRVIGSREVLVDQANWVRGRVTKAMSVVDASPLNDWSSVKVQFGDTHGRDNPTYGFIYPATLPTNFGGAVAAAEADKPHDAHAGHVATHTKKQKDAVEPKTAEKPDATPHHLAGHAKPHEQRDETQIASAPDPAPPPVAAHGAHHKTHPAPDKAKTDAAPAAHQVAHAKHHADASEQEAAAQPDPAPPPVGAHEAHHKTHPTHDESTAGSSPQPAQQLAAVRLPVHKHRLPDARLAYVY